MTELNQSSFPHEEASSFGAVPKFNGGSFTIEFLAASAKGFEVQTRQTLLRHEPNTPLPEAARIRAEREKEEKRFRIGSSFVPIVGIRNPEQVGNVLTFDIQPVTFPTYRAIGNPSERPETLAISNPTGTACVLLTSEPDSSHKIILQHRSPESFFYSDVPGASIAGMLDGKLDSNNRGRLEPITTGVIMANNKKEMFEELGLDPNDIADVRITGVAKDNVRIHNEFLLFGISPLGAREITAKATAHAKIKKGIAEYDFAERLFVLDGTPEAIEILLTQVKCPLPPTHTATFVAAGYSMVLERKGQAAADQWTQYLQRGIRANYRDIDHRVAAYWQQQPEKAEMRSANKPARGIHGYDPAHRPTDQGLPSITEELQRVGLITRESPATSEIEKTLDS